MRARSTALVLASICISALGAIAPDTGLLAAHLGRFRGHQDHEISAPEYRSIHEEYLAWIDTRIKKGASLASVNAELETAGLLSNGAESSDEMFNKSFTGYVSKLEEQPGLAPAGLRAISVGMYTGVYCNFDQTIVLYDRATSSRVAYVNAQQSFQHGYLLRALAVSPEGPGGRVIASIWVASNCSSNWNGDILRLEKIRGSSRVNILERPVDAFGGIEAKVSIVGEVVTFRWGTSAGDTVVLSRDAIARYRLSGPTAVRIAPIAESFGAFVDEWLKLDDQQAARWSTPEAAIAHRKLDAHNQIFEWQSVADCPGSPPFREITVEWSDSKKKTVFAVSGSRVEDLRMLAIRDRPSVGCREIDISGDASALMAQPKR